MLADVQQYKGVEGNFIHTSFKCSVCKVKCMTTALQHIASDLKQLLHGGDTGPHVNQIQLNLQYNKTKTFKVTLRQTEDLGLGERLQMNWPLCEEFLKLLIFKILLSNVNVYVYIVVRWSWIDNWLIFSLAWLPKWGPIIKINVYNRFLEVPMRTKYSSLWH